MPDRLTGTETTDAALLAGGTPDGFVEDRLDGELLAPQLADALGELITGDRLALELRVVDSTDARPS